MATGRSRAWRTRRGDLWPLLQGTAAAMIAWLVAERLPHTHDPFFAPIAAFVALNARLGERGRNALWLVAGVIVGIVVGEVALVLLPDDYAIRVGAATLAATLIAAAFGGSRLTLAQAASAAILTVGIAEEAGITRLLDALTGAGVALVFTQLLFSPEPVELVRRVEREVLRDIAAGLERVAGALEEDDDRAAERAIGRLRDMRDRLTELGRVRRFGSDVARRSPVWLRQRGPVVRESENAEHLDLLAASCLLLARAAAALGADGRRWAAPGVRDLAGAVGDLEQGLGERRVRQEAADRAFALVRQLDDGDAPPDAAIEQARVMTRTAAADLMSFAGVDPAQALAAVQDGTGKLEVSKPPASRSTLPKGLRRLRAPWRLGRRLKSLGARPWAWVRRARRARSDR